MSCIPSELLYPCKLEPKYLNELFRYCGQKYRHVWLLERSDEKEDYVKRLNADVDAALNDAFFNKSKIEESNQLLFGEKTEHNAMVFDAVIRPPTAGPRKVEGEEFIVEEEEAKNYIIDLIGNKKK